MMFPYGQANSVDMFYDLNDWFGCRVYYQTSPDLQIGLIGKVGGITFYQGWVGASRDTTYYMRMSRAANTVTLKIYDDVAMTNLLATLTDTCSNTNFRYMYAFNSYDSGSGLPEISGWCGHLNLYEGAPPSESAGVKMYDGSTNIELEKDNTSPVRIWTSSGVIGIAIVDVDDPNASAIPIWTGAAIKYLKKKS